MISFLLSVRSSIRFALVFIYVGCIMALSLLPPQDFPKVQLFTGIDKVVHFTMYFIFSILGCWALKTEINRQKNWLILPVIIGWGIFMELLQLEMRVGRSFEWFDILANSVGVITGILIYIISVRNS
jgi:VanZ family protein